MVGEALDVLDCTGHRVGLGEPVEVLDDDDEPVVVLLRPPVLVLVVDPVCVYVPRALTVPTEDDEGDLEEVVVFVEVLEDVVVLVVVVEGLTREVGCAVRVKVVDFVEVFDCVLVDVERAKPFNKIRASCSPGPTKAGGGVVPMVPNNDSNRSHRIVVSIL